MKASAEKLMRIGEAAAGTGLSLRTLRHWDNVGLVTPSARSSGGFRLYSRSDVERIHVIKSMKPLDLSLDEIRELLDLLEAAESGGLASSESALRLRHYTQRTQACISRLNRHLAYATELLALLTATMPK